MYNAKILEKIGASIIIKNKELTGEALNEQIKRIVLDKQICEQMGKKAYTISNQNVEEKIYSEIKKLL